MQLYLEIGSLQMIKLLLLGRTLIQYEWCPLEIRPGDKHAQREDATNTVEATEHRVHGSTRSLAAREPWEHWKPRSTGWGTWSRVSCAASEGTNLANTLTPDSGFQSCQLINVILGPSICGTLLWNQDCREKYQ